MPNTLQVGQTIAMFADSHHPPSRLVLVDNEVDVLNSLKGLLETNGYAPHAFSSGLEALENITQTMSCGGDGPRHAAVQRIDLLNALIERKCVISVIVLSGIADVPLTVEVMTKGAVTLIQKPFNSAKLLEAIHKAVDLSKSRKERQDQIQEAKERIQRLTAEELSIMIEASKGVPYKAISYETE